LFAIGWKGSWLFRAFADCNTDESLLLAVARAAAIAEEPLGVAGGKEKEM
jgi:hypothetical protein